MDVKLVRHTFEDDTDWIITNETVPIGTIYHVLETHSGTIMNKLTGQERKVKLYLLVGNGDIGWMPANCFEEV